jgi:hypothetical protein
MKFTNRINKINEHIKKRKLLYASLSGIFIFISLFLFKKGIIPMATIPTQSLFGIASVAVNIGIVVSILGALILLSGLKARASGRKLGLLLLGIVMVCGGVIMAGSSLLAQVLGFLKEIGIFGQVIIGLIVVVVLIKSL